MQNEITKRIEELIGGNVSVEDTEVKKNNGIIRRAIIIRTKDSCFAPTIYWRDDLSDDENIESIVRAWEKEKPEEIGFDVNLIKDKSWFLSHVIPKLVSKKQNDLSDIPHKDFLDLAIVYQLFLDSGKLDGATILLHKNHIEIHNLTVDDLDEVAWKNREEFTGHNIKNIVEFLSALYDLKDETMPEVAPIPMYIISNKKTYHGAVVMADVNIMKEVYDKLGGEFLIFPSSIHEIIVLPNDGNADQYAGLVSEINKNEVAADEVLSNSVYKFDGTCVTKVA